MAICDRHGASTDQLTAPTQRPQTFPVPAAATAAAALLAASCLPGAGKARYCVWGRSLRLPGDAWQISLLCGEQELDLPQVSRVRRRVTGGRACCWWGRMPLCVLHYIPANSHFAGMQSPWATGFPRYRHPVLACHAYVLVHDSLAHVVVYACRLCCLPQPPQPSPLPQMMPRRGATVHRLRMGGPFWWLLTFHRCFAD